MRAKIKTKNNEIRRTILKIYSIIGLIPLIITVMMIPQFAKFGHSGKQILENSYLSFQLKYQMILLGSVLLSLGVLFLLSRNQFQSFFRIGNISAPATSVNWLGIKNGEKWSSIGINMLIIISLVTATFLFFQFKKTPISWNLLFVNIHWILLFSLLNAFSEEMIFRFGVVSSLQSIAPVSMIILISAISFGIVHYGGTPGGFIGIGLAGIMGFILCKSIIETQGIFWAILIHFVQDVLIISSIVISNKS